MIFKYSAIVGKASGSLAAITFSNRSGTAVCAARGRRTAPKTTAQVAQQAAHAESLQTWRGFTSAEKLAWNLYAWRNLRANRLGTFRRLTGFQFFLSQSDIRIGAGIPAPTTVPRYGQLGVGTPAAIYFVAGGPYTVAWYSPTTDPHGYYIFSGHRPVSSGAVKKPFFHVLPAYAIEDYDSFDLQPEWDAAMGPMAEGELYKIRIRYVGNNSLVSAYATFNGTVYAS